MADYFSGIKPITPTYPVRPGQSANKDREPGKRKKKEHEVDRPRRSGDGSEADGNDDNKPSIDEHV
jgi:hypothetical protein